MSTRCRRIAELAKGHPKMRLTTLAHHIDLDWLHEAYDRTGKDGVPGIDGRTAEEDAHAHAQAHDANLQSLLDRAKSGAYSPRR